MKGTTNAQRNAIIDSTSAVDSLTLTKADGTTQKHTVSSIIPKDDKPTSGSSKFVTSGAVYAALDGKVSVESGKGLSTNDYTTAEKSKVANLPANANTTFATKNELTSAVSSVYKYKGSVNTYANLPTNAATGDVYNVVDSYNGVPAGTNWAWNGSSWDALGGTVTGYVTDSTTVNGKPLTSSITLTAADVSAVPDTRTVNNKRLNANITLSAADVGALATGGTAAKATADASGNNIVNTYATKTELTNGLAGKQNALTFDSAPTSGSSNPVTSGGVYSAIKNETVSKSEYQDLVDRIGTMDTITSKTYPYHKTFVLNATIPAISQTYISTTPSDDYRAITSLDSFTVKKVTETERCWIDGQGWVDAGIEFDKSANYPKIVKDISTAKGSTGDIVMYSTNKMYNPIKDALKTLIGQSLEVVTDDGMKLVPKGNITLHVSISKLRGNIYRGTSSSTSKHTILHENVGITSTLMNKDFEGLDISVADNKITAIPDIGNIYQTYKGAESGKYYSLSIEQQTVQITATITVDDVKLVGNVYPLSRKVGKLTFNFPSGFIDISELNCQFNSIYNSNMTPYHAIRTTSGSEKGNCTDVNISYIDGDLNLVAICPEIVIPSASYSTRGDNYKYYPRNGSRWLKEMLKYYFKKNLVKSGDTSNINCTITIGPLCFVARTNSNSDYELAFENLPVPKAYARITIVKGKITDVDAPRDTTDSSSSYYDDLYGASVSDWTKFTKFWVGAYYSDITIIVK